MSRQKAHWTPQEINKLSFYAHRGVNYLAKILPNRSREAIEKKLYREGINPYQEKFTVKDLVKITGFTKTTVVKYIKRLFNNVRYGKHFYLSPDEVEELCAYLEKEGFPFSLKRTTKEDLGICPRCGKRERRSQFSIENREYCKICYHYIRQVMFGSRPGLKARFPEILNSEPLLYKEAYKYLETTYEAKKKEVFNGTFRRPHSGKDDN